MPPERHRRYNSEPSPRERHNMLTDRMQMQFIQPIGPATAEFFEHLYNEVDEVQGQPHLWPVIDEVWDMSPDREMSPDRKADYVIEQLPRAFAALLLPENPNFLKNVHWPGEFRKLEDRATRQKFVLNTIFPVQSNVDDRAKAFEIELKVHGYTEDVIALELGSGGNYIGKHMALRSPYSPTQVMERKKGKERNRYVENPSRSLWFNETVASPIRFRRIIGGDIFDPNDPFVKNWRLACSLYFDERLDEEKVKKNNDLENAQPENVVWQWGDITTYTPEDYEEEFPGEPFPDITFASFVLYLLKKHEQRDALQNLAAFAVKGGGIAAVLDDIQSISSNHEPSIVRRKRNFGSTSLWAYDGQKPELGWLKHMSIRTGRVDAVIIEPPLEKLVQEGVSKAIVRRQRVRRTSA